MKAIWSSCTRAFSLPGIRRKRGREDDPSDAEHKKKKAKGELQKIVKNVDVDGELY
jgi:hypothetical protein